MFSIDVICHTTNRLLYALMTVLIGAMFSSTVWAQQSCHLKMAWNTDQPFTYLDEKEHLIGMDVEISTAITSRLGCSLEFIKMPWARSLLEARQGNIDMISGAFDTPERRAFLHYSSFGFFSPNIAFARKGDLRASKIKQLEDTLNTKLHIGVQIDVSYGAMFDHMLDNPMFTARLVKVSNRASLWEMLVRERVDLVFADRITGLMELKKMGLGGIVVTTPLVLSSRPAFFAFSKKTISPQWIERFDALLRAMDEQGELKAIDDKYLKQ